MKKVNSKDENGIKDSEANELNNPDHSDNQRLSLIDSKLGVQLTPRLTKEDYFKETGEARAQIENNKKMQPNNQQSLNEQEVNTLQKVSQFKPITKSGPSSKALFAKLGTNSAFTGRSASKPSYTIVGASSDKDKVFKKSTFHKQKESGYGKEVKGMDNELEESLEKSYEMKRGDQQPEYSCEAKNTEMPIIINDNDDYMELWEPIKILEKGDAVNGESQNVTEKKSKSTEKNDMKENGKSHSPKLTKSTHFSHIIF